MSRRKPLLALAAGLAASALAVGVAWQFCEGVGGLEASSVFTLGGALLVGGAVFHLVPLAEGLRWLLAGAVAVARGLATLYLAIVANFAHCPLDFGF